MYDMAEFLQLHERINLYRLRLAYPIDVVPGKVNKHDVLRTILLGVL